METKTEIKDKAAIVSVSGRIDAITSSELDKAINSVIDEGQCFIVLDFRDVDYISSSGLRVILAKAKIMKAKGGKILLSGIKGGVKEVFDISGFGSIFTTYETKEDAISSLG